MTDVRERLRRAGEQVAPPDEGFERLLDRRGHRRRGTRIAAALVAVVITAGLAVALLVVAGGRDTRVAPGGPPAASEPPPVPATGTYFYERAVVIVPDLEGTDPGRTEIESWWAPDGS